MDTENLHLDEHSIASFLGGGRPVRAPLRHLSECADCRSSLARSVLAAGLLPRRPSDEAHKDDQPADQHLSVRQIRQFHGLGFEGAAGEPRAFGIHALHLFKCTQCLARLIEFRDAIAPSARALSLAQSAYQRGQSARLGEVRIYLVGHAARLFVSSKESPDLSHEERLVQRALSMRDDVIFQLDSSQQSNFPEIDPMETRGLAESLISLVSELDRIREEAAMYQSKRSADHSRLRSDLAKGQETGRMISDPARFILDLEYPLREMSKYDERLSELRWQEQERLGHIREIARQLEAHAPAWMSEHKFFKSYANRYDKNDRFLDKQLKESLESALRWSQSGNVAEDGRHHSDGHDDVYQTVDGPGFRLALRIVDDSGEPEIEVWATVGGDSSPPEALRAEPLSSEPDSIAGLALVTVDAMGKASNPILTDAEGRARVTISADLLTLRVGGHSVNGVEYLRCRLDVVLRR